LIGLFKSFLTSSARIFIGMLWVKSDRNLKPQFFDIGTRGFLGLWRAGWL
jgi:hypothetical protein